jgi:NAD+ kinase
LSIFISIAPYRATSWSHIALDDSTVVTVDELTPTWRPMRLATDMEELLDIGMPTHSVRAG